MLKAVVFDYGGVISVKPDAAQYRALAEFAGLSAEELKIAWRRYRSLYDADAIDCAEMYRRAYADFGRPMPEGLAEAIEPRDSAVWSVPYAPVAGWMAELKNGGMRVAVLTNMSSAFARDRFRPNYPAVVALADEIVVSGEEHEVKPHPAIYRIMERRLGLAPGEILFFDDREDNVEGARACGWNAAVFTGLDAARAEFDAIVRKMV